MTDEMSPDVPPEPGGSRPTEGHDARPGPDDRESDSLTDVLTREGADAPDAADIDDPDRQL